MGNFVFVYCHCPSLNNHSRLLVYKEICFFPSLVKKGNSEDVKYAESV